MKPGWKTTEFWMTLAAAVAPFMGGAQIEAATTIAGALAAIYTAGRTYVKR